MEEEYVEGLSGAEIIDDIKALVAERLGGDCNLRPADSYTGGYDGWIEIHLNLHGLDTAQVKTKIVMGAVRDDTEQAQVVARIEIPLEPALNVVRERAGLGIPTLAKDVDGKTVIKKRHYAKPVVGGAATGEQL